MSITFGSVGDVISVCLLAKSLVDTLNDSRGSSAEYQGLVKELRSLERSLLEIEAFYRTHSASATLKSIFTSVGQTVDACQHVLQAFQKRLQKYESSLESGRKFSATSVATKIKWQLVEKDTIVKFRNEINSHCNALGMLLATANMYSQSVHCCHSLLIDSIEWFCLPTPIVLKRSTMQHLRGTSDWSKERWGLHKLWLTSCHASIGCRRLARPSSQLSRRLSSSITQLTKPSCPCRTPFQAVSKDVLLTNHFFWRTSLAA